MHLKAWNENGGLLTPEYTLTLAEKVNGTFLVKTSIPVKTESWSFKGQIVWHMGSDPRSGSGSFVPRPATYQLRVWPYMGKCKPPFPALPAIMFSPSPRSQYYPINYPPASAPKFTPFLAALCWIWPQSFRPLAARPCPLHQMQMLIPGSPQQQSGECFTCIQIA